MKGIKNFLLLVSLMMASHAHAQPLHYETKNGKIVLTETGAAHFAKLPLRCADAEDAYIKMQRSLEEIKTTCHLNLKNILPRD